MGDDRRRSWRELDRARESGGSRRRSDPDERHRERAYRSSAYGAYKAKLEKMFTPGGAGLPEALAAQLGPASEEAAAKKAALESLRSSPSDASLRTYLDLGLELPDDARFLMGLFDALEDEVGIRAVLERLLAIVEGGRRPNRMLLLQRLTALEHQVEAPETAELIADLRGALD